MVATGAVLFLIGTINSFTTANPLEPTEIVVEKHINPAFAEKLSNYGLQSGLPPFISNFMQHGTNIFFKPQFMLSPSYTSPGGELIIENKEDCKKWNLIPAIPFAAQPQTVMDEPVKIVETVVSDGELPVVDKVVIIKPSTQPLAEIAEHPIFISPLPEPGLDLPVSSPVVFSETPVLPPLPTSESTILETIPTAPELPTLEISHVPVIIDEPVEIPMVEVMESPVQPLPSIPASPELPPFEVPIVLNEPVEVLVPSLPPMPLLPSTFEPESKPEPKPEPALYEEVYENHIPLHIPEAPVLPPYSPLTLPVPIILPESTKECDKTSVLPPLPTSDSAILETIPTAPEIPTLEISHVPVIIDEPVEIPMVEVMESPVQPLPSIPASPELPPFEVPIVLNEPVEVLVPSLPPMPLLPTTFEPDSKPEPKPEPTPYEEVYENHIPLHIPEAPVLLPYSPPTLPVPIILPESTKECDKTSVLVETPILAPPQTPLTEIHSEPVQIAEAPILPEVISEAVILPLNPPALIEEDVPVILPQPPVLPPSAVTLTDIIVPQPALIEPSEVPEVIVTLQEPIVSEQIEPAKPIMIPSPPELPPLSMPDLPISVVVSEPIAPVEPLLVEPQPVIKEEAVHQSIEIPAPPVLSPMEPIAFPDVSAFPVVHDSPLIIAETSPLEYEIISNEIPLAEISSSVLPEAIPLLPLAPEIQLPAAVEELSVTNEETEPIAKPSIIPPAPELPPLSFQPMPVPLEEPAMGLYPPAEITSFIIKEPKLPQLQIPNAPWYMTFAEPPKSSTIFGSAPLPIVIPQQLEVVDKIDSPVLSQIESVISFPTTCVKNIVIERVLPNIVREGSKVVSSPSPSYPVLSPFSSTFGIRLY